MPVGPDTELDTHLTPFNASLVFPGEKNQRERERDHITDIVMNEWRGGGGVQVEQEAVCVCCGGGFRSEEEV